MITKLRSRLNFTSALVATTLLLTQAQTAFAVDTVVNTATTTAITLGANDTLEVTSSGSITKAAAPVVINNGDNTELDNKGTLSTTGALNNHAIKLNTGVSMDSLTNSGVISHTGANTGYSAIFVTCCGTLSTLTNSGQISSNQSALSISSNTTTIINSGEITGDKDSIVVWNGADVTNLTNSGTITSSSDDGIEVKANSSIVNLTNSGTIIGGDDGIQNAGTITSLINSGSITGTYGVYAGGGRTLTTITNSGTIIGTTYGFFRAGVGETTNVINSGTISGTTGAITNSGTVNLTLNKGSVLIGDLYVFSTGTLNITSNVGASKSYAYTTSGPGTITLNDLNNRPAISGSAYAVNIGSMEMAGENLYQNTSNIIDAIESNINTTETWVRPYYSESSRDAEGDSSAIRKFKNTKQGFTAGGTVKDSKIPLQFILNVDQSENNIDSGEHKIDSNSITLGLVAPDFNKVGEYNLSLKGLIGYSKNDTDRKILDNTSSTGERVITGDYNSFNAIVGASLAKTINLDNGVKANITIGADVVSEMRDSFSESLYFSYDKLNLVQLQPKIQSEFVKTLNNTSNAFVKVGVEARELLSGKTQDFSANSIKTSYTTPTTNDVYGTVVVGFNSKINNTINLFAEASAKNSGEEVSTYQASVGIKGTF